MRCGCTSSQDVKHGAAWEATQGMFFFLVLVSFLLLSVLFFI